MDKRDKSDHKLKLTLDTRCKNCEDDGNRNQNLILNRNQNQESTPGWDAMEMGHLYANSVIALRRNHRQRQDGRSDHTINGHKLHDPKEEPPDRR
ncbi:uncharacterized protein LOC117148563 [Drosophila mauritiana]|uniref:Uncharacterized protein LOC117148563 n=1 Tax=Drosophila mauritiana TaxID=7226 RepID=A0A6P8KS62_DROMA|nr:uncharacterized protein LOC117148563 [Drosophila mauritiana]